MNFKMISVVLIVVAISVTAFFLSQYRPNAPDVSNTIQVVTHPDSSQETIVASTNQISQKPSSLEFREEETEPNRESVDTQTQAFYDNAELANECLYIPVSQQEYIRNLEEKNSSPGPARFQFFLDKIEECSGVLRDRSYVLEQYKIAADMGDPRAMMKYGYELGSDVKPPTSFPSKDQIEVYRSTVQEKLNYYRKSATAGYVDGALRLADSYQHGKTLRRVFGKDIVLREPDFVQAYAWFHASSIVRGNEAMLKGWREDLSRPLETSGQLEEAQALGLQYYEQYLSNSPYE